MAEKRKRFTTEFWIFAGALLLLFSVFLWRQFYGFNKNDEIFYISTVYRFFQGDAMLVDEWNNVQLFAFITYPLYCFIRFFQNSNEGIVLIFRIVYLIFQASVAVYCFCRLKSAGWIRILPALYYFITTPYNINSLSYNTLAFGFVLLSFVTVACTETPKIFDFIVLGFFTAGAVLANPYAVLLFLIYGAVCVVVSLTSSVRKQRQSRQRSVSPAAVETESSGRICGQATIQVPEALRFKNYLFVCLGAFLIFVLFVLFVFSRGTLEEILECITYIVMDSERQKSFWEKFVRYFIRIHRYYRIPLYMTGLLLLLWLADRGKKIPSSLYLVLIFSATIPSILYYGFFWEMVGINYMLIPLAFAGFISYLITEDRNRKLFYGWYLPGLFYTLLAHFATNTGIYTVSASYMIPSAVSIIFIGKAVGEQKKTVWLRTFAIALFSVQFAAGIYQRIFYVWGDDHLPYLTRTLSEGPLKGIRTSKENEKLYEDVLMDLKEVPVTSADRLLVIGIAPWMYLSTEAECAAYSTWEISETDPLIPVYYGIRREKLPTVVYFYEYEESILETETASYFMDQGFEPVRMRRGILLLNQDSAAG